MHSEARWRKTTTSWRANNEGQNPSIPPEYTSDTTAPLTRSAEAPLVRIRDLTKSIVSRTGEPHVLVENLQLDIACGEFVCIVGPSGCGKTTVLNMVAGFVPPTSGILEFDSKPILGPESERGVVFQGDDSLFNWLTALQNVEFGMRMRNVNKKERRERAQHYLELVGLGRQADKYPGELSGGMKQRIQIARVLANEPKMLLLDEPFGALDAQTRTLMQEELAKVWGRAKISALFITHDIDEAIILGSRIAIMKAGPASNIKGIIEVDLPAGRDRTDPAFLHYYREVHEMIREEVMKSLRAREMGSVT